jgi:DNA helicase HerA-like ATPase
VSVIDIHNLHDQAKRFVVGVVLKRMFEDKEARGTAEPLVFTVLDELNRYAPRTGWSPIKEVLLDIAERGRSLGIILIGCQQTSSEVELRVIANAAFRVVGAWMPPRRRRTSTGSCLRQPRRAGILAGTPIVHQPELPVPLLLQFPSRPWATRPARSGATDADPSRGSDAVSPHRRPARASC